MSLKQQLTDDMKQAMRDRDSLKLNTIRFLLSEIRNVEIDQGEIDETAIQKIVAKQVKSMKDAIEDFKTGGREDIVEEEEKKITILETYLPTQLSDDELRSIAEEVKAQTNLTEMGPLIGAVMKKVAGRADGQRVSAAVKQLL